MKCPDCGGKSLVIDTRENGETHRRRRRCVSCEKIFATVEMQATEVQRLRDKANLPAATRSQMVELGRKLIKAAE